MSHVAAAPNPTSVDSEAIRPFRVHAARANRRARTMSAGHGAAQGIRRTDLQRHDLSVAGREVVQAVAELDPGVLSPKHRHPGEEIIYVLEGSLEYEVEGSPPVTLKAGDVLLVPAEAIHTAENVASGRGAELATYIVEKGKPLVVAAV